MIKIAICDDSEKDLADVNKLMAEYVRSMPELSVKVDAFSKSFDLMSNIEKHGGYDAYILDILMPGMSGLDVISEIRKEDDTVPVIILTNSKEYALEAYSMDVRQYLIKPVVQERFFKKMDALFEGLRRRAEECVVLQLSGGISRVPINNIVCVELSDHIMTFYMRDGSALESKYLRTPFAEAASTIINDPRFLRPHHSFLVNMNYVDKMTKQYFFMKNGRIIKIAKQKSKEASAEYLNFLSQQWRP